MDNGESKKTLSSDRGVRTPRPSPWILHCKRHLFDTKLDESKKRMIVIEKQTYLHEDRDRDNKPMKKMSNNKRENVIQTRFIERFSKAGFCVLAHLLSLTIGLRWLDAVFLALG